ncbi:MAG TPA: BTAD domain-containing putative transcriptional regulator [Pseudonocardiaceae bacterium]|nr:BTAD domain-containing putative transcriptional regulator [Pseudonocardiaceae bacterium]
MLGTLEVLIGGEQTRLGGPRPRAVLSTLIVHAGTPVSTGHLIDQVWGSQPPATAMASLQMHVSALRKVLGDRLVTTNSGYQLNATDDEVDASRFTAIIDAVRPLLTERPTRAIADLGAALALWRGEPFTGTPAGSDVAAARLRLSELRLSALEDRIEAELGLGRHAEVIAELAELVTRHPVRERLTGLYLLALYRCGRISDAQAAYQRLRTDLAAELELEPGAEIVSLARAIDRRDPTLNPPSRIPVQASRFIGRRREVERLAAQLGSARLLTVTGPGGSGKTRLALELARDTAADHPDGVYIVELASSPTGGSVADRIADALTSRTLAHRPRGGLTKSVRSRTEEPLVATLANHLRGWRALIVLDNCEHVIAKAAAVAAELLSNCAGLRILATSREPLGVAGEEVWPLAGLTVPAEHERAATAVTTEALRLLADRGQGVRAGFTIAGRDVEVASRLVRRLDGLPLAIELAAAQLRTRSLAELTNQLESRYGSQLALADRRTRTLPDRHQTMRAAIDWSYQLLDADEQTLFRAMSVFAGGATAEAIEQLVSRDDVHDLLARLVDQSVLVAELRPDGTRYRMLELVRAYATERLVEAGEADRIRELHALWCVALAGSAAHYGGVDHTEKVAQLALEEANLRAALDWCLGEGGQPSRALEIASPLWWYWWARGLMAEGRDWLRRALAAADPAPSRQRGSALRAAAALTRNSGDYREARALGEECLAVFESLSSVTGCITALGGLCVTTIAEQDFQAALRYGERTRDLADAAGDRLRHASALNNIGLALRCLGRLDEAEQTFTAALDGWRAVEDRRGVAATMGNLGVLALRSGNPARSRQLIMDSLRAYHQLDLAEGMLDALDALACLAIAENDPVTALRLLTVSGRERERLGAVLFVQDEIADRKAALIAAHTALGEAATAVATAARGLALRPTVTELLSRV